MKFLIVIVTLATGCFAAPNPSNTSYISPSPIHSSDLRDLKPEDRTTLITVDKYKRENSKPFYPTVLPEEVPHHVSKRDHKPGHDSHPVTKPEAPEPPKKSTAPKPLKDSALKPQPSSATKLPLSKRNRRNVQTTQQKDDVAATTTLQKPQTLPAVILKDGPKGLQTKQNQQPQTVVAHHEYNVPATALHKPQTLAAINHDDAPEHLPKPPGQQQHKRDIPVPLVPKLKHPEVSSKVSSSEEDSHEDSGEKKTDNKEEHKQIVKPHNENVQVEDLSEPKPVTKHTLSSLKHPHEFHPQRDHIENKHSISEEQKSVTLGDIQQKPNTNKVAAESTISTSEHPLIRPKPVPVSELFSRNHDN